LSTWVYRVSMNVCLSHLAKQKRRGRLVEDYRRQQDSTHEDTRTNPWLRRQLEQALVELPHGYRAVLILHDVEGLKHEEIARVLGCRVGTCKSQLHKARMRMRELLAPALNEAEVSP
jgi:RNA polymerase sigma-70 factor (ECF subfamily)